MTGEVIDILPGAQKHTNAVAVDMTIAYLILEVATIDSKRRVLVPRNIYSLSLPQVLDLIQEQRQRFGVKPSVFNDNTICLAAIEATLMTASTGTVVCKEDALYVPTRFLNLLLCSLFVDLHLGVMYREKGSVQRPTTEPTDLLDFRSLHTDPADRKKRRSANIDGRQECKLARVEREKALIATTIGQMTAGVRVGHCFIQTVFITHLNVLTR